MLAFNQYIVTKMDNESINFAIDVANSLLFQIAADNNCNKVVNELRVYSQYFLLSASFYYYTKRSHAYSILNHSSFLEYYLAYYDIN